MKDYRDIWIKWLAFLSTDAKFRKEFIDSLNIEVSKGFDVLTGIAVEQVEIKFGDDKDFKKIKEKLNIVMASSAFAGYSLYLISEGIDPEKKNLVAQEKTGELGNLWIKNYEKDNTKSLLEKIDFFLSLMLERQTNLQMNLLFLEVPEIQKKPYSKVEAIETYANWATHQGFIFGILENELNK